MATLYERMQAAWATNEPNALDYEAERMARQGVAETDIYAALEQLLLALRETGLEEEADDRINDVMDRVTGWCHPDHHIHTTRNTLPTQEEIAKLPRWSRVAFAVRCARRVLPLFNYYWPTSPVNQLAVIHDALDLAERAAEIVTSIPEPEDAAWPAGNAGDAYVGYLLSKGRIPSPTERGADHVARSVQAAADAATDPNADANPIREAVYQAATVGNQFGVSLQLQLRHDFDHLSRLAEAQRWGDDTPVPPEVFGPLWPEGPPKGWPPVTDAPSRVELVIDAFARERATEQMIEDDIVNLFNALNRYHIARSGTRLTLDQFHSLLPAFASAEV